MLRRDRLARDLLHHLLGHIPQCDHTHRLPHAQPNAWRHAPVQALHPVALVDIPRRSADRHLLRPIRIVRLALHLHANHLNRLVPRAQPTTNRACCDLLDHAQLVALRLPCDVPDPRLSDPAEPKPAPPIRHLPDRDRVDALVNAPNTFRAINAHERLDRAGHTCARGRGLVSRDLDRLHARAEAHCGVGLREAAAHAADDAADEGGGAGGAGVEFDFGRDEEEDGAFCGGFDPGPGDQSLVNCRRNVMNDVIPLE